MITNANNQPEVLLPLGNGNYHVNFGIEQITKSDPFTGIENTGFQYTSVEISGSPDYGKIISAIIREKYSIDAEFAIINAYQDGGKIEEYLAFQKWRTLAKWIATSIQAETLVTKAEIEDLLTGLHYIKVTMPISLLTTGGRYETLANDMLKKKVPWQIQDDNMVKAYLGFILPEHLAILQSDPQVIVEL